jgi:hypothetical protein
MDWSRWTRSPEKVRAALKEQPDNSVVTSKPLKIYVPKRFMEKQLAQVAAEIYIVGIFAKNQSANILKHGFNLRKHRILSPKIR